MLFCEIIYLHVAVSRWNAVRIKGVLRDDNRANTSTKTGCYLYNLRGNYNTAKEYCS